MPRGFSARFGRFASFAAIAVAAVLAAASAAHAAPRQAALVEDVVGHATGVEVMDYVGAGQTIRLGSRDTLVLSYLQSCVRETITGGTVTIGTDQSSVQGGTVIRTTLACSDRTFVLTAGTEMQFAGRVFRGLKPQLSDSLVGGPDDTRRNRAP